MWQERFGYKEGALFILGLVLVGILLQLIVGPVPAIAFAYPLNIAGGGLLILCILLWSILRSKARRSHSRRFSFLSGYVASLTSMGGLLVLLLVMGLTKQVTPEMSTGLRHPIHSLGLSSMLSTWYFLLLYLYFLLVLGCVTADRILRLKLRLRDAAFLLNHAGLFCVLFFGLMAAADMQRYRMQIFTDAEYPEWRGINEKTKAIEELPIAIELKKFEIEEYPPKLMVIQNSTGKPIPLSRPAHLSVDHAPLSGTIDGWQIEVQEHLPYSAAVIARDTIVFREFRSSGAVQSVRVRAVSMSEPRQVVSGWVSSGSHLLPYRSLTLTDSLSLVMAEPEPKQYSSHVNLYAANGDVDSATILVNKPLRYKGWYIYQLNYDREQGRWSTMSELELVKDDWLLGVYAGIGMLLSGAILLFLSPPKHDKS
ncbi:cytochrome c biogenesis protein ResB [Porphyromonas loveana]|uniref:cytochrome c biogenesis protein ResB n=1 Tax=Porphyromonas loveana TaxID=1884669 RepID=UPI00359FB7E3